MSNPFSQQVNAFFADTKHGALGPFHEALKAQLQIHFVEGKHGRTNQWNALFAQLPDHLASRIILNADTLEFGRADELEQKIIEYIDMNNKNPKPFVWTKSAKDILEKVKRARSTLDNINTI